MWVDHCHFHWQRSLEYPILGALPVEFTCELSECRIHKAHNFLKHHWLFSFFRLFLLIWLRGSEKAHQTHVQYTLILKSCETLSCGFGRRYIVLWISVPLEWPLRDVHYVISWLHLYLSVTKILRYGCMPNTWPKLSRLSRRVILGDVIVKEGVPKGAGSLFF